MPASASKSTSPSSATCPWSGRSSPAMALSVNVLPAPEGPNSTSRVASLAKAMSSSNRCDGSPMVLRTATFHFMARRSRAPRNACRRQAACEQQHRDAGDRRQKDEPVGQIILAGLYGFVDGDRHRLRLAGDAARDHQGRAEFAQRSGEREQGAGEDASPRQRQGDAAEDRRGAEPENLCRLLELRVDRLEGGACRFADEGKGDDRGGDHRALPGEDEMDAERALEPAAEPAASTDHDPAGSSRGLSAAAPSATAGSSRAA